LTILEKRDISIKGTTFHVDVVTTKEDQARGLGGRSGLGSDEGMLFVFPSDDIYKFWMKDMLFSIDMIWISTDGYVVDMRADVPASSYPEVFVPKSVARYVLEVSANTVKRLDMHVGDSVSL